MAKKLITNNLGGKPREKVAARIYHPVIPIKIIGMPPLLSRRGAFSKREIKIDKAGRLYRLAVFYEGFEFPLFDSRLCGILEQHRAACFLYL